MLQEQEEIKYQKKSSNDHHSVKDEKVLRVGRNKRQKLYQKKRAMEEEKCYTCDEEGHLSLNCPNRARISNLKGRRKSSGPIDSVRKESKNDSYFLLENTIPPYLD